MADTCRACLNSTFLNDIQLVDIFSISNISSSTNVCIADALMECTSIQISKDDDLPKSICSNCIQDLHVAHRFRCICVQSDVRLRRQLFGESKIEDSSEQLPDQLKCEKAVNIDIIESSINEPKVLPFVDNEKITQQIFTCEICQLKFEQKNLLEVHTKKYHNDFSKEIKNVKKNCGKKKHPYRRTKVIFNKFSTDDESEVKVESDDTILNINSSDDANNLYFDDFNSKKSIKSTFTCSTCDRQFSELSALNRHSVSHTRQEDFTCQICTKTFNRLGHLQIHIQSHTGDRPFECKICTKKYTTNSALTRHLRAHSNTSIVAQTSQHSGPFVCVECVKTFKSKTALQNHMRIHTGERVFHCEYCGKSFKQKTHLTVHRKVHSSDTKFTCEICSKYFITNNALKNHMQELHSDIPKSGIYSCEHCPKTFPARKLLVKHSRAHVVGAPCICEICGKSFRQKTSLTVHIRQHTGEKPFSCNICDKTFTTSAERQTHKVQHTNELPHQCAHCDMRFKWRITMWRHMKHHTGEKPKKCTICDKAFVEGAALRRHMRVHTDERPQLCKVCGKTFKESTHLKTHMKLHRNDSSSSLVGMLPQVPNVSLNYAVAPPPPSFFNIPQKHV